MHTVFNHRLAATDSRPHIETACSWTKKNWEQTVRAPSSSCDLPRFQSTLAAPRHKHTPLTYQHMVIHATHTDLGTCHTDRKAWIRYPVPGPGITLHKHRCSANDNSTLMAFPSIHSVTTAPHDRRTVHLYVSVSAQTTNHTQRYGCTGDRSCLACQEISK